MTQTPITDTAFNVKGLVEGKEYEFRVAAVNEAGPGPFSDLTEGIKPAPPPCKHHSQQSFCVHFLRFYSNALAANLVYPCYCFGEDLSNSFSASHLLDYNSCALLLVYAEFIALTCASLSYRNDKFVYYAHAFTVYI